MARSGEVGGLGVVCDCDLDSVCAVCGAYAGGNTFGSVDADGEGRAEPCRVVGGLRVQGEGVAFFGGEWQANKSAAELCHKIDDFGCDFFCGAEQVTLVLAVFIVHEDNHFALTKNFNYLRYLAEF